MATIQLNIVLDGNEATEFEAAREAFNAPRSERLEPEIRVHPFAKMLIRKGGVLVKAESNKQT